MSYKGGPIRCFCLECGCEFSTTMNRWISGRGRYCSLSCKNRGKNNPMFDRTGKKHPMFGKTGESNPNFGNHLSKEAKAKIGIANFKCGKKESERRHQAKRRKLGSVCLMPLEEGEVGHHATNTYIIGIPKEVHEKLGGGNRKKHRVLVLEWLKQNDKKKYKMVLCVLINEENDRQNGTKKGIRYA